MGLTIHFSGAIDHVEDIPQFVEELTDIANSMGWLAQPINMEETDPNFRGVLVNPAGNCEPLRFLFGRGGRLRNLMDLWDDRVEPNQHSFYSASKIQFASIETHIWIVGLLRYLKKHYISDLEVHDEGEYWETEDLEKLRKKKQLLPEKIDRMASALSAGEPFPEGASTEDIVTRIERIAKDLHEDKKLDD
ncbi:MAG: hypothetical protein AAF065_01655 [Verrucomicrobiota bacterium]